MTEDDFKRDYLKLKIKEEAKHKDWDASTDTSDNPSESEERFKKKKNRLSLRKNKRNILMDVKYDYNYLFIFSKINDQDTCGNCWAYSALSMIEMNHFMLYQEDNELSVSYYTLCSFQTKDACNSGNNIIFETIFDLKNIFSRSELSNISFFYYKKSDSIKKYADNTSQKEKHCDFVIKSNLISYYNDDLNVKSSVLNFFDSSELKIIFKYISRGPFRTSIIIGTDAGFYDLQFYTGGFLKHKECSFFSSKSRHAVVISYYEKKNNKLILGGINSWGSGVLIIQECSLLN